MSKVTCETCGSTNITFDDRYRNLLDAITTTYRCGGCDATFNTWS